MDTNMTLLFVLVNIAFIPFLLLACTDFLFPSFNLPRISILLMLLRSYRPILATEFYDANLQHRNGRQVPLC